MKIFPSLLLIALALSGIYCEAAEDPGIDLDILAQRGNGVVTQEMFTARAEKIPEDVREPTLRNPNRLRPLLNDMLLKAQLAADARVAGFDKDKIVKDRMQLAADNELAEAWLEHYADMQPAADFEQLARESFLLKQDNMMSPPKIDVSHILISNKERTDDEARALADEIYAQVVADPDSFVEVAIKYSEDPSVASNHGSFKKIKEGDLVKPFEEAAFAMQPGEISRPVKTEYGYHIIRLDAYYPPQKQTFNNVKTQLIEQEREKHRERIKRDYLERLTAIEVQLTEEQMGEMVRRNFGDEDPKVKDGDSE